LAELAGAAPAPDTDAQPNPRGKPNYDAIGDRAQRFLRSNGTGQSFRKGAWRRKLQTHRAHLQRRRPRVKRVQRGVHARVGEGPRAARRGVELLHLPAEPGERQRGELRAHLGSGPHLRAAPPRTRFTPDSLT
jgi:hypothetical protein